MNRPNVALFPPRSSAPGIEVHELDLVQAIGRAGPFKASRFIVDVDSRSRLDSHASHECWMVASGEGIVIFDGHDVPLKQGDVVYFPPFSTHQAYNNGAHRLEIFSTWWLED